MDESSSHVPFDLQNVLNSDMILNDEVKYGILKRHFQPNPKYKFPLTQAHGCNRSCNQGMLEAPFVYSKEGDSIFCLNCALFVPTDKRANLHAFCKHRVQNMAQYQGTPNGSLRNKISQRSIC